MQRHGSLSESSGLDCQISAFSLIYHSCSYFGGQVFLVNLLVTQYLQAAQLTALLNQKPFRRQLHHTRLVLPHQYQITKYWVLICGLRCFDIRGDSARQHLKEVRSFEIVWVPFYPFFRAAATSKNLHGQVRTTGGPEFLRTNQTHIHGHIIVNLRYTTACLCGGSISATGRRCPVVMSQSTKTPNCTHHFLEGVTRFRHPGQYRTWIKQMKTIVPLSPSNPPGGSPFPLNHFWGRRNWMLWRQSVRYFSIKNQCQLQHWNESYNGSSPNTWKVLQTNLTRWSASSKQMVESSTHICSSLNSLVSRSELSELFKKKWYSHEILANIKADLACPRSVIVVHEQHLL